MMHSGLVRLLSFMSLALATLLVGTDSEAQQGSQAPGDSRVRLALNVLKLRYRIVGPDRFRLVFPLSGRDGRTQLVFIESKTETIAPEQGKKLELREVWSPGFAVPEDGLPVGIANALLEENADMKIGAWDIDVIDGKKFARFVAKISATGSPQTLRTIMTVVAQTADAAEEDLTSKDEF